MESLIELEDWLIKNNVKDFFLPNNKRNKYVTDIGQGIEDVYGLFIWYSNDEKGNRTDIEFFINEKDAVNHVHQYLLKKLIR